MAIGEELLAWLDEDVKDLSPSGQQLVRNSSWLQLIQHGLELDGQGGDANAWRAAFQAYLAAVAYADRCLGLLLEAMLENPARENTVVIVWSDHGYHLGDKKREGKTTLWEAANRSNLLIIDPSAGVQARGRRVAATVSLQDIYPTVVAMAGLDRPAHVHGRDLRPLVRSSRTDWTHPVLSTNFEGNHALRTERYRYLRYAKGDTELYDLATDPLEQNNLAQSSSTKGILQALDRQLDAVLALRASDY
jgi:arylsulfatase A-like enzyme